MENIAKFFFYLSLCNQKAIIHLTNPRVLEFLKQLVTSKYSSSKTIIHVLNTQINFFYQSQKSFKHYMYLTHSNLLTNFLLSKFVSAKFMLFEPFINLIQVDSPAAGAVDRKHDRRGEIRAGDFGVLPAHFRQGALEQAAVGADSSGQLRHDPKRSKLTRAISISSSSSRAFSSSVWTF